MQELLPDKAIAALEQNVIYRFADLNPTLGIIIKKQAPPDDVSYLNSLIKLGKKYNVRIEIAEVVNMVEASKAILAYKTSALISGIIILSDFGAAQQHLCDLIPSRLDLDCSSTMSIGKLVGNTNPIAYRNAPCAAVAALKLLGYEDVDLTGKNVAVLGRSMRVGRPLAEILTQQDATVTLFHSKSALPQLDDYDIVISAIGVPHHISKDNWDDENLGQTKFIIDVGINEDENKKIIGDVDIKTFKDCDVKITPVPGGVGVMASVVLMSKLFTNAAISAGELNG